jgi:ABC-type branched-subunit amino acid transport system substrate-binding protein
MLMRAIVASFVLFIAMIGPTGQALASETVATPLRQALALYQAGAPDRAIPLLEAVLAQEGEAPDAWQVHLALARIYHQRERFADVLAHLGAIPAARHNAETRLLEGLALTRTDRPETGLRLLRNLPEKALNGIQIRQRMAGLADAYLLLHRPLEALYTIHRALARSADPSAALVLSQQAHNILKQHCSDAQLSEAGFLFRPAGLGLDASLQLAWRAFEAGNRDRASALLDTVLAGSTDFPYRGEALLLQKRLANDHQPLALGVLLPLSGRFSGFGLQVRQGMELALEQHNRQHRPAIFLFRDCAGDPTLAGQAVAELAVNNQLVAILGPLTGAAAVTAARQAEQQEVPLLTLSQRRGLAETGPWVFRNSLTSDLQARALVRYAMAQRGFTTFGILAPQTPLGQELSEAFRQAVTAGGGQVVAAQAYDPRATDFGRQIKLLLGKNPDAPEEESQKKTEADESVTSDLEVPPFEALFLPDTASRVALIAPQLAFYGLHGALLLGSNGWNAPQLLEETASSLNGAVFVTGFYRASPYPFVREFVNRYFERFGQEPTLLAAQGFDSAAILLSLLQGETNPTRAGIRSALGQHINYPGVTGATGFTPAGDADKVLYLLQVDNNTLSQIE